MTISKNIYRKFKSRDYFPLFFYEYYKQNPYDSITVKNDYNRFIDVAYIIDNSIRWEETSQGFEHWEDIYMNEIKYRYDNNIKKDI